MSVVRPSARAVARELISQGRRILFLNLRTTRINNIIVVVVVVDVALKTDKLSDAR